MSNQTIILLAFCLAFLKSTGQLIEKDYYTFPIKPGGRVALSGTMGELRGNHFHAGIDIKTDQVEGLPVYAAADGFVSRVKVSPYGYGNALYIQHPNGQTTVYGHLLSFRKDIDQRVLDEQYAQEEFGVEIFPEKNEFPVKKGEIIAKSGNTGGSGGPHLHWEIRDGYQRPINPLLGKFSEVQDNIDPIFYKVGFTTLSQNAHLNNEFGFFSLTPIKLSGSSYKLSDLVANGEIGISIQANDKLNGAANRNGVAGIEVYVNEQLSFRYYNERFSFSASKMINHHIEYERYKDGYGKFHRCYVADGNTLDFYEKNSDQGRLVISDTGTYEIKIKIWDAYNNESNMQFRILGQPQRQAFEQVKSNTNKVRTRIQENIMRVATNHNGQPLQYYMFGEAYQKEPNYIKQNEAIYTFDLRKTIPDSLVKGDLSFKFDINRMVVPDKNFTSYHPKSIIKFPNGAIKDTLYLSYSEDGDDLTIGDHYTPIYKNIKIMMKPQNEYPDKKRTAVYHYNGSYNAYVGGTWMGKNIEFDTRNLGTFKLLTDTKEPTVQLLSRSGGRISLKIKDNLSGINTYRATLNGEFLCMSYRYQTGVITSIPKNDHTPLKGVFELTVTDQVGNSKIYTLQL